MNMITKSDVFVGKSRVLNTAEIQDFGKRVEEIRAEIMAKVGQEDADYIYKVRDFVRYSEIASRTMLMFGGWIPPVWLLASALLGASKIVQNMELGHNVMHAQFDWMNDPSLSGATFDWDTVCSGEDWKYTHNYLHHTFTNIIGRDHDVGYGLLRVSNKQDWKPINLLNVPALIFLMVTFQWSLSLQNLRLEELAEGKTTLKEIYKRSVFVRRKMVRQFTKDYVFFPIIAGPMFLPVVAGNLTANVIRNLWASAIIFCGHFTDGAEVFDDNYENETRADWYLRQIKGSSNIVGGKWMDFMSGNLSHQMEHHLFPDMPANRYKEASIKIRALCEEYDQQYNTGSFAKELSEVFINIAVNSFPKPIASRLKQGVKKVTALVPFLR